MKYRSLASGLLAICLVGSASAQEVVKTVFARTLHVVIPGDVSSGGVSWSKTSLGLPRSWSAQTEGSRTEVAEESISDPAAQQARLKEILPGVTLAPVKVSGVTAWEGIASGSSIIGVPLQTGFWIVLAQGPTAKDVTDSVCAERQTPKGFMPRTIPGGMSMVLPYNFSPRRGRPGFEMKFDGFEADLVLDQPEPGKRFDLKKTMDDEIAGFKENEAYKDVKIDRKKVPGNAGELAIIKFKEGGRAKERFSVMGVSKKGEGVLLHWTFDPGDKQHRDISNRMANTFKTTDEMVVAGERFDCGNGFSFETSASMEKVEKGDVDEWIGETGGLVVTARHVRMSRNADPSGAAALFPDLVKAQMKETPGFKTETVPYVVNGVDGLLVKTEWKNTWRYGLFLATFEGIYVLDVLGMNKPEVEQAIRSAQISITKPVDPLKEFSFKDSNLKLWTLEQATRQSDTPGGSYKLLELVQIVSPGEGLWQTAMHTLNDDEQTVADLPAVTKNYVESFAKAMGGKVKILNHGWQSDAMGADYWYAYEIETKDAKFKCYMTAVASGRSLMIQTGMLVSGDSAVRGMGHLIMNSYQLSKP